MDPVSDYSDPVKVASKKIDAADEPVQDAGSHTLSSMQHEFEFFTTGVLYAAIPNLNRDLVRDFLRATPSLATSGGVGVFSSTVPLFSGLGEHIVCNSVVDMDRTVYAVHKSIWEECRSFIGGAAFIDQVSGQMHRIVVYEIPIVDRIALKKMNIVIDLPTVKLSVFAVNGPAGFSYLSAGAYPTVPALKVGPMKTAADLAAMESV